MKSSKSKILELLNSNEPDKISTALKEVDSTAALEYTAVLLNLLKKTENDIIRNELALFLADHKVSSAFEIIVMLLQQEKTSQSRGTLLYALGAYDCSSILPILVDFVIKGNFETSSQANSLIHQINAKIEDHVWEESINKLKKAMDEVNFDKRPLIADTLSLFLQDDQ